MSSNPPRRSIHELDLDNTDEISLYLELVRIIEKDIDEIAASATRNGWTSWAIIGGIAAALLMLFGETRKLQSFPTLEVETICLGGVLVYNVAILGLKVFYPDEMNIRPGRVRWPKDVYFSFIPAGVFTLLIFLTSIFIAFTLPLPMLVKTTALAALSFCSLLMLTLLGSSRSEYPLGNNRMTKKFGLAFGLVSLFLSLIAIALLGTRLRFPLGEDATLPYLLSGLTLAVVLLIGRLIVTMAPSRLLSNLKDLRNDIIFLRADIDEGLKRYEILTEGETLSDAHQKELSELLGDISVIGYIHSNMGSLIQRMLAELPRPNDSQQTKEQKTKQVALLKDSYLLHEGKCREILSPFEARLKKLNKKLGRVSVATEDWAGASTIHSSLAEQLALVELGENQLKQRRQAVDFYIANPEKISPELLSPATLNAGSANLPKETE